MYYVYLKVLQKFTKSCKTSFLITKFVKGLFSVFKISKNVPLISLRKKRFNLIFNFSNFTTNLCRNALLFIMLLV